MSTNSATTCDASVENCALGTGSGNSTDVGNSTSGNSTDIFALAQQFSLLTVGGVQLASGFVTIKEEGYITPALINSAFGTIGFMLGLQ